MYSFELKPSGSSRIEISMDSGRRLGAVISKLLPGDMPRQMYPCVASHRAKSDEPVP